MKAQKASSWPLTCPAQALKVSIPSPGINLDEVNKLLNEKIMPQYIEELKKVDNSFFFNSSQCAVKCDVKYVDETKIVHIRCDRRVAKILVDIFVKSESSSKDIVKLRC